MQLYCVTFATVITRFACHISFYRLQMNTSNYLLGIYNDGINPFMFSNLWNVLIWFFSARACLTLAWFAYIRLPLWRHCACITTYSPMKAPSIEAGDTDSIGGYFWFKITWFVCYNCNDRVRIEIDHGFAAGAVVARTTIHSWGRPAPRCPRSNGRLHSFVVTHYIMAGHAIVVVKDINLLFYHGNAVILALW